MKPYSITSLAYKDAIGQKANGGRRAISRKPNKIVHIRLSTFHIQNFENQLIIIEITCCG